VKAIVSRASNEPFVGFPEVGMSDRAVFGPYKRRSTIIKKAQEYAGPGKHWRVEFYPDDCLYGNPLEVVRGFVESKTCCS
jgi:hypothetical protein